MRNNVMMNNTLMIRIGCGLILSSGAFEMCAQEPNRITHGPILGRPGATQMSVWARTAKPGPIRVEYRRFGQSMLWLKAVGSTSLIHDNTGLVTLSNLRPNTRYDYRIFAEGEAGPDGSFKTWPSAEQTRNARYNPEGLFNFRFEFACGNSQREAVRDNPKRIKQATYDTLLRDHANGLDFAILNGDWLYEDKRDYTLSKWQDQVGIKDAPDKLKLIPSIAGVWENYKAYLARGRSMSSFHRQVPSFYTIDDHEILNDVAGSGQAGFSERRAVFRDIGTQAWLDYLAWSNPMEHAADIHFGRASLTAGSDVLTDFDADFKRLPLERMSNLHVHWGGKRFGERLSSRQEYPGLPNAGVYDIAGVKDRTHLRISPPAQETATGVYSIGRRLYGQFRVSNCHFFLLDTRSHRDVPDFANPARPDRSMLGAEQLRWLQRGITGSNAEFIFVVSSVNFMIPHSDSKSKPGDIPKKGEAWTVFLHEREQLIDFWDELKKPVFLLTGDLHNSFAIQITDNVWEFASGPHESTNHTIGSEGHRPLNGSFKYGPRSCDILWSSYLLPDTPKSLRRQPHFCVIQVNNVTNNPRRPGEDRWIAFPRPQVIFQYYDGLNGDLKFAHTISSSQ